MKSISDFLSFFFFVIAPPLLSDEPEDGGGSAPPPAAIAWIVGGIPIAITKPARVSSWIVDFLMKVSCWFEILEARLIETPPSHEHSAPHHGSETGAPVYRADGAGI